MNLPPNPYLRLPLVKGRMHQQIEKRDSPEPPKHQARAMLVLCKACNDRFSGLLALLATNDSHFSIQQIGHSKPSSARSAARFQTQPGDAL